MVPEGVEGEGIKGFKDLGIIYTTLSPEFKQQNQFQYQFEC